MDLEAEDAAGEKETDSDMASTTSLNHFSLTDDGARL